MNQCNFKPNSIYNQLWLRLNMGANERNHDFHNAIFTNYCKKNNSSSRVVILRNINKEKRLLFFHTDYRSNKIKQIKNDNNCMILFYSHRLKEQLRIQVKSKIHYNDSISKNAWEQTQLMSRKCYLSLKAPGTLVDKSEDSIPIKFLGKEPNKKDSEIGYKNFAVISNHILSIEWLSLSSQGHKRIKFNWNNSELSYQWLIP